MRSFVRTPLLASASFAVLLAAMGLVLAGGPSVPSAEATNRNCGAVNGTGEWKRQKVTVWVRQGAVRCGLARKVARRLFSDRAKFHPCVPAACAFWTVKVGGKRWKGGYLQGFWVMRNKGRVVGGAMR